MPLSRLVIIGFSAFCYSYLSCTLDKVEHSEKYYSDYIQTLIGGEREVVVEGGRIDLVSRGTAYEIEWASNWKESIGQALWYALQSNSKAGIIIILEDKNDYKYFIQLNSALTYAGLDKTIEVKLYPTDFEELIEKD